MPSHLKSIGTCLALIILTMALPDTAHAKDSKKTFGDWILTCPTKTNGRCALVQQRATKNTQSGKIGTILSLGLSVKDDGSTVMTIGAPLGVELTQGIILQIDKGKAIRVPFNQCIQLGCLAVVNVADDFLALMRKGTGVSLTFLPYRTKKAMRIEASLKGFTSGYKALAD